MKVFILSSLFILTVHAKLCCKPEGINLKSVDRCEDDQEISLSCPSDEERHQILVSGVTNGSMPDDAVQNVCHGTVKNQSGIYLVLTVCRKEDYKIWNEEIRILQYIIYLLHIISFLGSLLTTIIYYRLPNLQGVYGICTYHFSLHLAMFHGLFVYEITFGSSSSPKSEELCITNIYVFAYLTIATLLWSCILSYNTWREHRPQINNAVRQANICRLVGYGLPLMLVSTANLQTHLTSIYKESKLETDCRTHSATLMVWYTFVCATCIPIINCYFFVDSRRYLWRIVKNQPNYRKSFMKKLKFRISLNVKLFCIMNIPLTISEFSLLLNHLGFPINYTLLMLLIMGLPAAEGSLVFLILVVFRKRVLRGLAEQNRYTWSFSRMPNQRKNIENKEGTEESTDTDDEDITLRNLEGPD